MNRNKTTTNKQYKTKTNKYNNNKIEAKLKPQRIFRI